MSLEKATNLPFSQNLDKRTLLLDEATNLLFSQNFDKRTLIDQARLFLYHDKTEKSFRAAFIHCAAVFFSDRELLFDNKPMVLQLLEIISKLCQLKPDNSDYMQQFARYIFMSLAEYAAELDHQLIPVALFKRIHRVIQLNVLAQPKLSNEWTSNEIKELLTECLKDPSVRNNNAQDLVRINLIIRYCKEGLPDAAREQLHLLVLEARPKKDTLLIADDLVDTLKADIDLNDVKKIVALLFAETDAKLVSFYHNCVHRALYHFLQSQTQDNSDFLTLFLTAENAVLKEFLRNSSLGQPATELQVVKTTDSSNPMTSAIPLPPPPPIIKSEKGRALLPVESRAKTISRNAGRELFAVIKKNSGYENTAEQGVDEKAEEKSVDEKANLVLLLEKAMSTRRFDLGEDETVSDEDERSDWDTGGSLKRSTSAASKLSSKDDKESKPASKNNDKDKQKDQHKDSHRSDKLSSGKQGKSERDLGEKKAHHKDDSVVRYTRPLPGTPNSAPPTEIVAPPKSPLPKQQRTTAMELAVRLSSTINPAQKPAGRPTDKNKAANSAPEVKGITPKSEVRKITP